MSRATISRLENGDPTVQLSTFLNVCRALKVLEAVEKATNPYETDLGRAWSHRELPQRVRR